MVRVMAIAKLTRDHALQLSKLWTVVWLLISAYPIGVLSVNQCYSCMSEAYGKLWDIAGYDRMYFRPQSFTDYCKSPEERPAVVGKIDCDDLSSCITMIEDFKIGSGMRGYLRGCYNSIFRWGFNKTGHSRQLQTARTAFCGRYNLTELIAGFRPHESTLTACACKGHLCNGADAATISASPHLAGVRRATAGVSLALLALVWRRLVRP